VPVITLLVTPEDAEILSLASNETRIQLVLRNPLDAQKAEPPGTAVARLFRGGKGPAEVMKTAGPGKRKPAPVKVVEPPPAPPPPPPPIVVELLKGPARSLEKFQPGEKLQP
jgi:pilus assembly protein CpaB